MELNKRHLEYAALAGSVLALFLALTSGVALLALVSVFLFGVTLVLIRFGDWLIPWVLERMGHRMAQAGRNVLTDAVVQSTESRHLASVFLRVEISHSPSASSTDATVAYAAGFEKMISALRFPVKYSVLVYALDTERFRDDTLVRRLEAEMSLGRLKKEPKPNAAAVAKEERALSMHTKTLDRLASGEKPLDAEYLVMTTAQGSSEQEAVAAAKNQARQLKAVIGNALAANVEIVTGTRLLQYLDWEFVLPPTYEAFVDSV